MMKYRKTKRKSRAHGSPRIRSPIVTRSVTRRRAVAQQRRRAAQQTFRMKSMVYITGPRIDRTGTDRVAQVIKVSRNKEKYAVRLNYNGQVLIVKKEHLRKATAAEKRAQPKLHRRESPINQHYLESLEEH